MTFEEKFLSRQLLCTFFWLQKLSLTKYTCVSWKYVNIEIRRLDFIWKPVHIEL